MRYLYILIPFVFLIIFFIPIRLKVKASYNVFQNRGAMGLFVFRIKLKSLIFRTDNFDLKIYDSLNSQEESFDFSVQESVFAKYFIFQMKKMIKIKRININYNIGLDDAYKSAMLAGFVNAMFLSFISRLKFKKPKASFLLCDNVSFNKRVFEISANMCFSISLFAFVYSCVKTLIIISRQKKCVYS